MLLLALVLLFLVPSCVRAFLPPPSQRVSPLFAKRPSGASVGVLTKKVLVGLVHQETGQACLDALIVACLDKLIDGSDPLGGIGAAALRNGDNTALLGEWSTVYTSQPVLRSQCTLRELVTAKKGGAESALLTIHSVRQSIRRLPSPLQTQVQKTPYDFSYDNRVQFSFAERPDVEGVLTTRGYASCSPLDPCRLVVKFFALECEALETEHNDVFARLSGDWPAMTKVDINSHSDMIWLDQDLRVMRGALGSLYILQKVE